MIALGQGIKGLERNIRVMEIIYIDEVCLNSSNLHLNICVFYYVLIILLIKFKIAIALQRF